MQMLRTKLYDLAIQEQNSSLSADRKSQVGTGDRSERIRTYNFPQNRVTDHRLAGERTNFPLSDIIDGGLDALIDALATSEQTEKLGAQAEE